jgi:hypothetical protein
MFNNIQDPRIAQGFQSLVRAFGGGGSAADIIQADLDRRRGALIDAQVLTEGGQLAAAQALAQNRLAQAGLYGAQTGEVTQRTDALGSLPGILGGETVDQAALAAALLMGGLDINQGPGAAAMAAGGNPYGNAQNFSDVLAATGVMSDYANTPAGTAAELEAANAIAAATDATNRYGIDRDFDAAAMGHRLDYDASVYNTDQTVATDQRGQDMLDGRERAAAALADLTARYGIDQDYLAALAGHGVTRDVGMNRNQLDYDASVYDTDQTVAADRYGSDQARAADVDVARIQYGPGPDGTAAAPEPVAPADSNNLMSAFLNRMGQRLGTEALPPEQLASVRPLLEREFQRNGGNLGLAVETVVNQIPVMTRNNVWGSPQETTVDPDALNALVQTLLGPLTPAPAAAPGGPAAPAAPPPPPPGFNIISP